MKLLSIAEAAERLNIKEDTLRKWLKEGKIKGIKLGKLWRIREEEIEELIRKGEQY